MENEETWTELWLGQIICLWLMSNVNLGLVFPKIWQILKHFSRAFRQTQALTFRLAPICTIIDPLLCSIFWPREILQNLLCLCKKKTQVNIFVIHFKELWADRFFYCLSSRKYRKKILPFEKFCSLYRESCWNSIQYIAIVYGVRDWGSRHLFTISWISLYRDAS